MGDFGSEFFNFNADHIEGEFPRPANDGHTNCLPGLLTVLSHFVGAGEVTIYFPPGTYFLPSTTVVAIPVPSNVTLKFADGARLTFSPSGVTMGVSVTITMTVGGGIDAGLWQIFDTSGGGTVVLNTTKLVAVYPEWWGVNQSPPVPLGTVPISDSSPAIQAAFDAAFNNLPDSASGVQPIPVHLSQPYYLSSPLTITAPPGAAGAFVVRGVQGMLSNGVGHPSLAANWNTTGTAYGFAS